MILTDLFESPEIHNQDRLDSVLGRCIELIHEKNGANPKKYGRVAACIIDMKNRKVFGINSPGPNGTRRHAERMAIDAYHKRYGKILPGAIIVTTLSPCNREMAERDGPSCQDLLMQAGIEKVYSGYMDPSQHSDHPFTEEVTQNDDLWRRCKEFSDSFVHDDLTESQHNTMASDQVLDYVKRTHAPEEFDIEYSITDHPEWELKTIPLSQLNLDPDGEATDPYNRVNWVDDDKVRELIPRIASVLKSSPIVVDTEGWVIDGNHRAVAAAEAGMTSVPALVPVKQDMAEGTEQKPVVIYTNHRGATIDDDIKKSLRTTQEPFNKLQMWEKHKSMQDPKIADWVTNKLLPELKQNGVLKPLLVWNNNGQLFVIDGNHRLIAYQEAGYKGNVPVQLVPDNMITVSDTVPGQQGVAENFADGRNPGRKGLAKRSGVNTKASVSTLRNVAKHSTGEKQRMAHWLANMKAGRAKARKK